MRCFLASWLSIDGLKVNDDDAADMSQVSPVSPDLNQYYVEATESLLKDEVIFKMCCDDVASNPKLSPLLPHFVSFVRAGIQKYSANKKLLLRFLIFLNALFDNVHLNFGPKPYVSKS